MKPGKIILAAAMAFSLYTASMPDVLCRSSPNNRSALEQKSLEKRVSQTASQPIWPATAQRADDNAIQNIIKSTVKIETRTYYEDTYYKNQNSQQEYRKIGTETLVGTGILLRGNYFLTARRIINNSGNPLTYFMTEYLQEDYSKLKEIKSEYFAEVDGNEYSLEKVVDDVALNFSLLKFKHPLDFKKNETYRHKIGGKLQANSTVYVVREDYSSTDLHVTSILEAPNRLLISIPYIEEGDRGRFVFIDDENAIPCIVGMITELKPYQLSESDPWYWKGYATSIDPIIEKIRQHNPKVIEEWESQMK